MSNPDRNILKALFRAHRSKLALIVILQIICVLAQVDSINILRPLMDEGVYGGDMDAILNMGGILIVLTIISSITLILTSYLASQIAAAVAEYLRLGIMSSAVRVRSIDDIPGGDTNTMTCLTTDVTSVQRYVFESLRTYLPMPFLMAALFYYTYQINTVVGLLLIAILVAIILVTFLFSRRVHVLYKDQVERVDAVNSLLRSKISGARPIRAMNGFEYETQKFEEASSALGVMNRKIDLNSYYLPHLATAFMWMFVVLMFAVVAHEGKDIALGIEMIVFMQYATYIVSTMAIIPYLCTDAPKARIYHDRIMDIITASSDSENLEAPTERDHEYALRFKDIEMLDTFGRKVMDRVSIDIRSGEVVTIVGPNGCGNSDLISIAMGFSDMDAGSIMVDGMDTSSVDSRYIRDAIAYAGNTVHIFMGTFRYNLDPHGRCDDYRIMEVCDRIGLGDFIKGLPEGLDTQISEGVSTMSGGQKLLIVIARSLLRDAPIYVFHDCFFSLDPETKGRALRAILDICKGRSVVFLMHDISTCGESDEVILMDRGKVLDRGSFDELMTRSKLFNDMCTVGQGRVGSWA